MPNHFCSSCAHKITYETAKPKSCPKCRAVFADLTKALTAAALSAEVAVAYTPPTAPVKERPAPRTLAQQAILKRAALAKQAHKEDLPEGEEPLPEEEELDELYDDNTDPREVRARMRQLAASMKVEISMDTDKDDRISASDWCGTQK